MEWRYALCEPNIGPEEIAAATDCIASGWLSMGPRTRAFEEKFAEMHGAKHAFAVANGTAALHLAMAALDIGRSAADEVIQPAINFVAAANMTRAVGAKPVFADIISLAEPNIAPAAIEALITPQTRAVVVMHYAGYPVRISEIKALCARHNLKLIEDACHGPATPVASEGGRYLGTFGDVGCFSFFSNKNMTCGEGGMVITDDDALADAIKALRSHGMTTLSWDRHKGRAATYDVTAHGFNYRIDDLRSALGLVQLEKLPAANARRQQLATAYRDAIAAAADPDLKFVFSHCPADGAAHVAGITVPAPARDAIRQALADARIQTSLHYPGVHQFSAFATTGNARPPNLPVSEAYTASMITVPLYPGLPEHAPAEIVGEILRAKAAVISTHKPGRSAAE